MKNSIDEKLELILRRIEEIDKEKMEEHKKELPKPLPPKREKNTFEFENDEIILEDIFHDIDTVNAIIEVMRRSPLEIQVIYKIIMDIYAKIEGDEDNDDK